MILTKGTTYKLPFEHGYAIIVCTGEHKLITDGFKIHTYEVAYVEYVGERAAFGIAWCVESFFVRDCMEPNPDNLAELVGGVDEFIMTARLMQI